MSECKAEAIAYEVKIATEHFKGLNKAYDTEIKGMREDFKKGVQEMKELVEKDHRYFEKVLAAVPQQKRFDWIAISALVMMLSINVTLVIAIWKG